MACELGFRDKKFSGGRGGRRHHSLSEGSVCRPRNLGLGGVQGRVLRTVPGREEEEASRGRGHITGSLMCGAKVTLIL